MDRTIKQGPGYAVIARYTAEENKKILEAVKLLARITSGSCEPEQGETFANRVERNFCNQEGEKDFSEAVFNSILECSVVFEQRYPEEIPSLHAIFQTAGADGVVLTLRHTSNF